MRTSLLVFLCLLNTPAWAAVYRCIDADGTSTFSDRACEPKKGNEPKASAGAATTPAAGPAQPLDGPHEKKAAHILDRLHIAAAEPEMMVLKRTVDDAAPDLVKGLDPDNLSWTPANGRWQMISEFVKSDLRRDVQTALRSSSTQVAQISARQYAARADESDMDALLAFLSTPEGARYVAFQNEIRPVLYAAESAVGAVQSNTCRRCTSRLLTSRSAP